MQKRYERITFEKDRISIVGKPIAAFVSPGHPLLNATLDLIMERYRDLLKRGSLLVDPDDQNDEVRVLFYLEHAIQDGRVHRDGKRWVVSRQMQFVEIDSDKTVRHPGYAPYLDYRPITDEEHSLVAPSLEAEWLSGGLESQIIDYAVECLIPEHIKGVKARKEELVPKTIAAVKERLTKEINHWDNRANDLKLQEEAGKPMARINSAGARQRADELSSRLKNRLEELEQERRVSSIPPVVIGGCLVLPQGLLDRLRDETPATVEVSQVDRKRIDKLAVAAVLEAERSLGREPKEMPHENPGYDIESRDPRDNRLLFIEVKGKVIGATTVTVSKTQIFTAFNKPDDFILAIVEIEGDTPKEPRYIRQPFQKEPDFGVTSVNYNLNELLARAEAPR